MDGLIIKNTGAHYVVLTDEGEEIAAKVKGNFRIKGLRTTNPVAVGDRVEVRMPDSQRGDDTAYITAVHQRKNYIIRRSSNLSKEAHIIASNLDQAFLVVTLAHPVTSTTFIDRFLATAEAYGIEAFIVINKIDLLAAEPDGQELLEAVANLYRTVGYDVIEISATEDVGLERLRQRLAGKITLLSGNSGVGKTTIINHLLPGLNLRTAPISAVHDTGMHTTTFSEMFRLPGDQGGWIIDTPGVKGFGTIDFDADEVAHFFPEIFKRSADCRYNNCTHTHEPGCAVREALDRHEIALSRFNSYLSIREEAADPTSKYRKPQ